MFQAEREQCFCVKNNYNYRIHKKNSDGTKAYYKCVEPAVAVLHIASSRILLVMHEHVHEPNLLQETARSKEKKMIAAAALMGRISPVEVLSKIKTSLERSDHPEARSSMRTSKALTMALSRGKKKQLGHGGNIPKTVSDIVQNLPEKFMINSIRNPFLRYMSMRRGPS